eukprot:1386885-Alexandrium_andersonii.AAC.1
MAFASAKRPRPWRWPFLWPATRGGTMWRPTARRWLCRFLEMAHGMGHGGKRTARAQHLAMHSTDRAAVHEQEHMGNVASSTVCRFQCFEPL